MGGGAIVQFHTYSTKLLRWGSVSLQSRTPPPANCEVPLPAAAAAAAALQALSCAPLTYLRRGNLCDTLLSIGRLINTISQASKQAWYVRRACNWVWKNRVEYGRKNRSRRPWWHNLFCNFGLRTFCLTDWFMDNALHSAECHGPISVLQRVRLNIEEQEAERRSRAITSLNDILPAYIHISPKRGRPYIMR